jgi:protein tyrosine phosphatase (PTP) superfamily phosphohydrolase (DUF442 family)
LTRTRKTRPYLVCLLILLALLANGEEPHKKNPGGSASPSRTFGTKRQLPGLPNFGEVTASLFRGGQPSNDGLQALAKMGIDIVVDLRGDRSDSEGKRVRELGMQYIPIGWHCASPHDNEMAKFLNVLRDNRGKKVFVHCHLGDDRTGMMIAAYRMAAESWSADEAFHEMQFFGFSSFHHVLCPGLASYEHKFPSRLEKNSEFEGLRPWPTK